MSNVKIFRLVTGQYVIADVAPAKISKKLLAEEHGLLPEEGELEVPGILLLKNAAEVVFMPDEKSRGVSVTFGPLMFFTEDRDFELDTRHILVEGTPDTKLLNAYNARFGTGIVVPDGRLSL